MKIVSALALSGIFLGATGIAAEPARNVEKLLRGMAQHVGKRSDTMTLSIKHPETKEPMAVVDYRLRNGVPVLVVTDHAIVIRQREIFAPNGSSEILREPIACTYVYTDIGATGSGQAIVIDSSGCASKEREGAPLMLDDGIRAFYELLIEDLGGILASDAPI
jgi:hypothetical protein